MKGRRCSGRTSDGLNMVQVVEWLHSFITLHVWILFYFTAGHPTVYFSAKLNTPTARQALQRSTIFGRPEYALYYSLKLKLPTSNRLATTDEATTCSSSVLVVAALDVCGRISVLCGSIHRQRASETAPKAHHIDR